MQHEFFQQTDAHPSYSDGCPAVADLRGSLRASVDGKLDAGCRCKLSPCSPQRSKLEALSLSSPRAEPYAVSGCPCGQREKPSVRYAPACTLWSALAKMQAKQQVRPVPTYQNRACCVDWLFQLGRAFELHANTIHIAVGLLDRYMVDRDRDAGDLPLSGLACLKLADVFMEVSKEYYKQDNAKEYADMKDEHFPAFGPGHFGPQELVAKEKDVLRGSFDLHLPTVAWFAPVFLSIAELESVHAVRTFADFLTDLSLLDA